MTFPLHHLGQYCLLTIFSPFLLSSSYSVHFPYLLSITCPFSSLSLILSFLVFSFLLFLSPIHLFPFPFLPPSLSLIPSFTFVHSHCFHFHLYSFSPFNLILKPTVLKRKNAIIKINSGKVKVFFPHDRHT